MQKIEGTTIKLNRGDVMSIILSIKKEDETYYTFENGDTITFSVYRKGKMNENAILLKEIQTIPNTTDVEIRCTSEDTKLGDLINKPIDYWYEIELNDEYTVLGYDDSGAKILRLYPEGSKIQ